MKVLNNYKQQIDGTVILTYEDVEAIAIALTLAQTMIERSDKMETLETQFKGLLAPLREYSEHEGHYEGTF